MGVDSEARNRKGNSKWTGGRKKCGGITQKCLIIAIIEKGFQGTKPGQWEEGAGYARYRGQEVSPPVPLPLPKSPARLNILIFTELCL